MSINEDHYNTELEQLVAAARPTLDTAAQHRLLYAAGLAAGREQALGVAELRNGRRWMLVASHGVSSLAAGWLVFVIMSGLTSSSSTNSTNSRQGSWSEMARREPVSTTEGLSAAVSDEVLRPITRPEKLVEFINDRVVQPASSSSEVESESVLTSRSILF